MFGIQEDQFQRIALEWNVWDSGPSAFRPVFCQRQSH